MALHISQQYSHDCGIFIFIFIFIYLPSPLFNLTFNVTELT